MFQRLIDFILSFFALLVLSPLFFVVVIILSMTGEKKVIFYQERVGKNMTTFKVIKFVTMREDSENIGTGTVTVKNDFRILPVGKFLRDTKINELPQLINILKGDMSLIGPRPLTFQTLPNIEKNKIERIFSIRPGLSGLASLYFRNEEEILPSGEEGLKFYDDVISKYKAELDIWYSKNNSLNNYLKIIYLTIIGVIFRGDITLSQHFIGLPKPPDALAKLASEK